jgi:hypothetical protein
MADNDEFPNFGAGECAKRIFKRLWRLWSGKPFPEGGSMSPAVLSIIAGEIEKFVLYPPIGDPLAKLKKLMKDHRYDYSEIDLVVQCPCGWKDRNIRQANAWEHWTEHLLEASLASF